MIIKGNRRGGAKQLADHLLRRDTNEEVLIREITGYPGAGLTDHDLSSTLRFMAAQGQAKGKLRTLYHAIIAPQEGETLNQQQLKYAADILAKNLGMEGHQRVIVEHRKDGRQHFHLVFNILHPTTGKQARLQWTRKFEWNTGRQLEQELGLKPVVSKGRASKRWEHERGKRSGINPQDVRQEVTAIYHASKTGAEFNAKLNEAGYILTKGKNNSYVLVDKAGHIHGLLRRLEGVKLKDLRIKFPDLKTLKLPSLEQAQKQQQSPAQSSKKKGQFLRSAIRISAHTGGRAFIKSAPQGRFSNPALQSIRPTIGNIVRLTTGANRSAESAAKKQAMQLTALQALRPWKDLRDAKRPNSKKRHIRRPESERAELLAWAWENGRFDVLAQFGIMLPPDYFEP
jgi:hypothetical protein